MSSNKELHDLLVELNKELKHTNSVSYRDERLLRHLEEHIGRLAQEPEADKQDLRDQLETAVAQLEAAHPTLTIMMTRAITVLSNMGI